MKTEIFADHCSENLVKDYKNRYDDPQDLPKIKIDCQQGKFGTEMYSVCWAS
jgi:hypothetical protein